MLHDLTLLNIFANILMMSGPRCSNKGSATRFKQSAKIGSFHNERNTGCWVRPNKLEIKYANRTTTE